MSLSSEELLIRDKYDGEASRVTEEDRTRLASGEPLAYVIGWIPFLGLRITLPSKPLIPRPETEWWVEDLIHSLQERTKNPTIHGGINEVMKIRALDVCAGSGAIGCALLAKVPHMEISFGEIDPAHEATIRENIRTNGLDEARADIRIGDLFAPFTGEQFDIIATNPPYIPESRELAPDVARFEPALALRAGKDGLDLIRRIGTDAPAYIRPGGELWMEVDASHAEEARELVAAGATRAELRTDLYGRPRLIVGYY